MALCPFADYFNHAEEGCEFDYDASGCWLTADRDYRAGEEIFVSYGKHTNDFLLVEYGFTLSPNRWDNIKLDEYILPKLKASQKNLLEAHGLMGNYALDSSDICYRTQAAIRGLVLSKAKLRQFLAGENDGEEEQGTVDRKCVEILVEFQKGARKRQITIDKLSKSPHKECLTERWKQLDNMISSGIQRWC